MAPARRPEQGAVVCTGCGIEKHAPEDFKPRRRDDGSKTWTQPCKACAYENARRWTDENRGRVRVRNKIANAKRMGPLKEMIREAKSQPCADCGVQLQWQCMDLDHVRGQKVRTIGNGTGFSPGTLAAEIAKCDVRCPSCHRLRHWRDAQGEDAKAA